MTPRYVPFLLLTTRQRPVRRAVRVRTPLRLLRPLTNEQVSALFATFTRLRDQATFLLMLQGGLRPGEALGLHLEDVQYGRRGVVVRCRSDHPKGVRTKSRVECVVDLHEPEALAAVSAYVMRERPANASTPYLFLVGGRWRCIRHQEPLGYSALAKLFKALLYKCHCLLRAEESALLEPGAGLLWTRLHSLLRAFEHQDLGAAATRPSPKSCSSFRTQSSVR